MLSAEIERLIAARLDSFLHSCRGQRKERAGKPKACRRSSLVQCRSDFYSRIRVLTVTPCTTRYCGPAGLWNLSRGLRRVQGHRHLPAWAENRQATCASFLEFLSSSGCFRKVDATTPHNHHQVPRELIQVVFDSGADSLTPSLPRGVLGVRDLIRA